uniref:Uncharacterized protein n=1 Tax=Setaria viridis TaxID=4556 RepID=A0A4U6UPC2_SETVI|nr:hypothetical protein SEVIR_5G049300v2 [Setaria viridis]
MSVVRLCIARTKKNKGCGTGFVMVDTANKLVVMTCAHSLNEWVRGTKECVSFHGMGDASVEAVVGHFLVTLGHRHGMRGYHDTWNNFGLVT